MSRTISKRIAGGPLLNQLFSVSFNRHNMTIGYSLPGGIWGGETSDTHQIVNYAHETERFGEDLFGGKFYLKLNSALWEYHRNKILHKVFPEQVGTFEYRIGIAKLLEVSSSQDLMVLLEKYASEFVKDILDGPQGINTQIRKDYPSEPDETLMEDMGKLTKKFNMISLDIDWLNFSLFTGYPGRRNREYYLTHLSDGFIAVLEFEGVTKSGDLELSRIVEARNLEATSMMFNSIRLLRN